MSARLKLPIGTEFFNEFRRDGYYYIDKTEFIRTLLDNRGKVNLFTRPRRFGKTLTMSMLKSFFEIGTDETLFDGLAISRYRELCDEYMGRYPVISLSLKGVDGISFDEAFGMLGEIIWSAFQEHSDLLDSPAVKPFEKKTFERILYKEATQSELLSSLKFLSALLTRHNNKPVIILIDEYDVPLQKAEAGGFYEQMVKAIRTLLGEALKTNSNLAFAVVTGCLRISKESIFTGLNNLEVDTVMDTTYNRYFGFTHSEVEKLAEDYGIPFAMRQLTEWYDGYNFGGEKMYCPWDVLNQCKQLLRDPEAQPGMYWETTSSNDVIRRFIGMVDMKRAHDATAPKTDAGLIDEIERLIAGESVYKPLIENLTYKDMPDPNENSEADISRNTDNLYNILLMTGYLTAGEGARKNDSMVELRIPNAEVKDLFARKIQSWFAQTRPASTKREMYAALWSGEVEVIRAIIDRTLIETISCFDYYENYYHGFLVGLLVNEGYTVYSNGEFGLGRADIMVVDAPNKRAMLIEVKAGKEGEDEFASLLKDAIEQIGRRRYSLKYKLDNFRVIQYGFAFIRKSCEIRIAE
ncbi:MAG: AAA family ATPase [Clostridia bacterium]|nr:AAA family ATPase [Clostridia bacterium]